MQKSRVRAVPRTISPDGWLPAIATSPREFSSFRTVINAFLGSVKVGNQRVPDLGQHPLGFGYTQDDIVDPLYTFFDKGSIPNSVSCCIRLYTYQVVSRLMETVISRPVSPSLEGCLERSHQVPHVGLGCEVHPYDGPPLLLQCLTISLCLRRLERSESVRLARYRHILRIAGSNL